MILTLSQLGRLGVGKRRGEPRFRRIYLLPFCGQFAIPESLERLVQLVVDSGHGALRRGHRVLRNRTCSGIAPYTPKSTRPVASRREPPKIASKRPGDVAPAKNAASRPGAAKFLHLAPELRDRFRKGIRSFAQAQRTKPNAPSPTASEFASRSHRGPIAGVIAGGLS